MRIPPQPQKRFAVTNGPLAACLLSLTLGACATGIETAKPTLTTTEAKTGTKVVHASFYKSGARTANGERFLPLGLTAAHRSLRFGTRVEVTNLANSKSVIVRINDRGPFIRGREIDLSLGAARRIGLVSAGHGKVELAIVN